MILQIGKQTFDCHRTNLECFYFQSGNTKCFKKFCHILMFCNGHQS